MIRSMNSAKRLRRAPPGASFSRLLRRLPREQCSQWCGHLRLLPVTTAGAESPALTAPRTRNAVRTSAALTSTVLARCHAPVSPRANPPVVSLPTAARQETSAAPVTAALYQHSALQPRRPYAPRGRPSAPLPAGAKPYVLGPAPSRWFSTLSRARACVRPLRFAATTAAIQPQARCAAQGRMQDSADAPLALLAAATTSAAAAHVQGQVPTGSVPEGIDWTLRRDYSESLGQEDAS
jgi:hypothetical protein